MTEHESEAGRLLSLGHYAQAEDLYRNRVNTICQSEGVEASYRDQYHLSISLVQQQKFAEAEHILKEVLAFLTSRQEGRDTENFAEQEMATRKLLSQALRGQGRSEGAEGLLG
ncbi:hypothetical protein C1H76_9223 [Elsinoe australis]|uniref:Tetratricopeptide repeat protein n=1 Tax=Elsinoe australis TaxID=40998 RepID=A0A4U7ASC4_9PEZI|nr:hypothetical protein C1H76_9223 [Elsinoe australis]